MQSEKRRAVAFGQRLVGLGGVHQAARGIVLLDGAARVGADLHDEHVADRKLGADAHQEGGQTQRVGLGQFGEVAGAHQHLDPRHHAAKGGVALDRGGEAEMDRLQHGIGDIGAARRLHPLGGAP